jgi:hypothetical protein
MDERPRFIQPIAPGTRCGRCTGIWTQRNTATDRCFWCTAPVCVWCAELPLATGDDPTCVRSCAGCACRVRNAAVFRDGTTFLALPRDFDLWKARWGTTR